MEEVVISIDNDSRSEQSPDHPYPPSPVFRGYDRPTQYVHSMAKKRRAAYVDARIRRTKLGDLAWDGQTTSSSIRREKPGNRSLPKLSTIGLVTEPEGRQMDSLVDLTTPHSAFTQETLSTNGHTSRPKQNLLYTSKKKEEHFTLTIDGALSGNETSEENEIVFDKPDESQPFSHQSLWEGGSIWKIDTDDFKLKETDEQKSGGRKKSDRYHSIQGGTREKLKNIIRKSNCLRDHTDTISEKAIKIDYVTPHVPLEENLTDKKEEVIQVEEKSKVDEPRSRNIGFLQHFTAAPCGRYSQFDENKLRAIVQQETVNMPQGPEVDPQQEETRSNSNNVKDFAARTKGERRQRTDDKSNMDSEIFSSVRNLSCNAIPAIESMKAETPKFSSHSKISYPHFEPKRPRPHLQDTGADGMEEHLLYSDNPKPTMDNVQDEDLLAPAFDSPIYSTNPGEVQWNANENEQHITERQGSSPIFSSTLVVPATSTSTKSNGQDCQDYHYVGSHHEVAGTCNKRFVSNVHQEKKQTTSQDLDRSAPETADEKLMEFLYPLEGIVREVTERLSPKKSKRFTKRHDSDPWTTNPPSVSEHKPHSDMRPSQSVIVAPLALIEEKSDMTNPELPIGKPLVSALRKGSTKSRPTSTSVASHNDITPGDHVRTRRVVFSEKVEEAFFEESFPNDIPSSSTDNWAAEEFMRALSFSCGRDSDNQDYAYSQRSEDNRMISGELGHKEIKRRKGAEVVSQIPEGFSETYSGDSTSHSKSTADSSSDSLPLLANFEKSPEEPSEKQPQAVLSTLPTESVTEEGQEVIVNEIDLARLSKVGKRFSLFRRRKAQRECERHHTIVKTIGRRQKNQYKTLKDGCDKTLPVRDCHRNGRNYISSNEESLVKKEGAPWIGATQTMNPIVAVPYKESTIDSEHNQRQKKTLQRNGYQSIEETTEEQKKKKLRLKFLGRRQKGKETENQPEAKKNSRADEMKKPQRGNGKAGKRNRKSSRRFPRITKPARKATELTAIPEEESTQGSITEDARLNHPEIKPIMCDTMAVKRSFRKNLFGRKNKRNTEKKGATMPLNSLYARRQQERINRFSRMENDKETQGCGTVESSLPPVLIVQAEKESKHYSPQSPTRSSFDDDNMSPSEALSEQSSDSETYHLIKIEKLLARQMMEDLLLLAKLEKQQRELLESGGQTSSMSQKMVDTVVARVENTIKETKRIRKARSLHYGRPVIQYSCPMESFGCYNRAAI